MFYYKKWDSFCRNLKELGCLLCTGEESLREDCSRRFVVLKHDIEDSVPNAHKLAGIEHKYGIRGSYYVQAYLLENENNVRLLQEMQSWGHEISYHYDVLDANAGDYAAAEKDFDKYLKVFYSFGFRFKTICQHGNPVKKRVGYTSNRDFFRNQEILSKYPDFVDMVVNYSQNVKCSYKYISDAGYSWNLITEPETNDLHPGVKNVRIGNFDKLFSLIKNTDCSYVVSTHPHRWRKSALGIYCKIVVFRCARTTVMILRKVPFVESILNKFYFLAKKI